jgi:hypothetical protein
MSADARPCRIGQASPEIPGSERSGRHRLRDQRPKWQGNRLWPLPGKPADDAIRLLIEDGNKMKLKTFAFLRLLLEAVFYG